MGDMIHQVVHNQSLYNQITEQVLVSQTFLISVTNQIVYNETIVNNITQEVTTNQNLFQEISQYISTSNVFVTSVTEQIINSSNVINHITNEVLHSETLIQNIANTILTSESVINVLSSTIALVALDGSRIATNDDGTLTVQTAANDRYGIVKGQANNTPATWHNVSAENGLLSINREEATAAILNAIQILSADGLIVGQNEHGVITLPIYYVEVEPVSPVPGTLYLIKEDHAITP